MGNRGSSIGSISNVLFIAFLACCTPTIREVSAGGSGGLAQAGSDGGIALGGVNGLGGSAGELGIGGTTDGGGDGVSTTPDGGAPSVDAAVATLRADAAAGGSPAPGVGGSGQGGSGSAGTNGGGGSGGVAMTGGLGAGGNAVGGSVAGAGPSGAGGVAGGTGTCSGNGDGLLAYWKFDETSGEIAADATGLGNDATAEGTAPVSSTQVAMVSFLDPGSFAFSGTSDVGVSAPHGLPQPSAAQTVAFWFFYATTPSAEQTLFSCWLNNGPPQLALSLRGDNFQAEKFGADPLVQAPIPSAGAWHHVAYVNDGSSKQSLYIDGVLANSATASSDAGSCGDFHIGAMSGDYSAFTGTIDDVRIYSRSLSDSEVGNLASGSPRADCRP